jgi:hypothetical protein
LKNIEPYKNDDLNSTRYWQRMFKEDIFWKESEIRKLITRNNPEINNYKRSMQETIEHEIMKRSYEIVSNEFNVVVIGKEQFWKL